MIAIACIGVGLQGGGAAKAQTYSPIKSDEVVLFFPTAANLSKDEKTWHVPIHGLIFEPEENDLLRGTLLRELRDEIGEFADPQQHALVEQRLRLFLMDNERYKRVGVRIAGSEHTLPPSARDGYFSGSISLAVGDVGPHLENGGLRFRAILRPGDTREFNGLAYCLPPTGVSVISDVDDTIKVSDVRNKRELLLNSLAREFRGVAGMATAYQKWAEAGAAFHYISASPWQLYRPLEEFAHTSGFPAGTFYMKRVRIKDQSLRELFADPHGFKVAALANLMERFPNREFILVGDSGERDPEAFASLLRQHPDQIPRVYVRDVTGEPADSPRYREAFQDVPRDKWQVFTDPATLEWPAEAATR